MAVSAFISWGCVTFRSPSINIDWHSKLQPEASVFNTPICLMSFQNLSVVRCPFGKPCVTGLHRGLPTTAEFAPGGYQPLQNLHQEVTNHCRICTWGLPTTAEFVPGGYQPLQNLHLGVTNHCRICTWGLRTTADSPVVSNFGVYLITHANKCTYILFKNSKIYIKQLKRSYMFRSHYHPQGAYTVPC